MLGDRGGLAGNAQSLSGPQPPGQAQPWHLVLPLLALAEARVILGLVGATPVTYAWHPSHVASGKLLRLSGVISSESGKCR